MKSYPNRREIEVNNMFKTIDDHYFLNDKTDLVYSPDDSGWYVYDFRLYRASTIYATRAEACEAYVTDSLEWETK